MQMVTTYVRAVHTVIPCIVLGSQSSSSSDQQDPLLPMDNIRQDSPRWNGPFFPGARWYTYRDQTPSSPTPHCELGFVHLAMYATVTALLRVMIRVNEVTAQMQEGPQQRLDVAERSLRFRAIAEQHFGGDNIANLFGNLVTAVLVRTWEVPLQVNLLAYRLLDLTVAPLPPIPSPPEEPVDEVDDLEAEVERYLHLYQPDLPNSGIPRP